MYPSEQDIASSSPLFEEAVTYVRSLPKAPAKGEMDPTTHEQKLAYYGLYKQATEGSIPKDAARPGVLKPQARYKYDAWKAFEGMSVEEAKTRYVDLVAMAVIVGSRKPDEKEFYEKLMAGDNPPVLLIKALKASPDEQPIVWQRAKEIADAKEAAEKLTLSSQNKQILDALYMQSLYGDTYTSRPGLVESMAGMSSQAQWDRWNELKGTSKFDAIDNYIMKVEQLQEE